MKGAIFRYSDYDEEGLIYAQDGRIYQFKNKDFINPDECKDINVFHDISFTPILENRKAIDCQLIAQNHVPTFIIPEYTVLACNEIYWDYFTVEDRYRTDAKRNESRMGNILNSYDIEIKKIDEFKEFNFIEYNAITNYTEERFDFYTISNLLSKGTPKYTISRSGAPSFVCIQSVLGEGIKDDKKRVALEYRNVRNRIHLNLKTHVKQTKYETVTKIEPEPEPKVEKQDKKKKKKKKDPMTLISYFITSLLGLLVLENAFDLKEKVTSIESIWLFFFIVTISILAFLCFEYKEYKKDKAKEPKYKTDVHYVKDIKRFFSLNLFAISEHINIKPLDVVFDKYEYKPDSDIKIKIHQNKRMFYCFWKTKTMFNICIKDPYLVNIYLKAIAEASGCTEFCKNPKHDNIYHPVKSRGKKFNIDFFEELSGSFNSLYPNILYQDMNKELQEFQPELIFERPFFVTFWLIVGSLITVLLFLAMWGCNLKYSKKHIKRISSETKNFNVFKF